MAEIIYFGYGANKDYFKLREILGKEPKGGEGAVLQGFNLAIQTLNDIPDQAKNILNKVWGDNFQSYTIKPGTGMIEGRVWILDQEDLEKLKEWEFVGNNSWKEFITVTVTNSDGKTITALTEKSREEYGIKKLVDGLNYEANLNKEGKNYYSKKDEYKIELMRKEIKEYHSQYANA